MTDLEMTKLCAEAMGLEKRFVTPTEWRWHDGTDLVFYDPLHDDAQAMALVKRFSLSVHRQVAGAWWVTNENVRAIDNDPNRAIVECVARMQKERT